MFKLQDMRDHKHLKWPVRIFFLVVIVSFIFFYGWSKAERGEHGQNREFAKLRSDSLNPLKQWTPIDGAQMQAAQQDAIGEKMRLLPPQWAQMLQQQPNTLERLVNNEDIARAAANDVLLGRAAAKMNFKVSEQTIIDFLNSQPGITEQALEMAAQQQNMTKWQFIEKLRQDRETAQVREVKGLVAQASLFELWQEYSLGREKITMELAAYPAEAFEGKVVVTEADLKAYLAKNKDKYHVPAQRRYAFVKLSREELRNKITPTDQQLDEYYQQNKEVYSRKPATRTNELFVMLQEDQQASATAVRQILNSVRAEAAKQADWTSLTQQLNAKHPGLRFMNSKPWIEEGDTMRPPAYANVLKTLHNDEVSSPVLDERGAYMFRKIEERTGGLPPIAEQRDRVLADYRDKKAGEELDAQAKKFEEELKRIKADEQNTSGALRRFAQAVKLKDELTTRVAVTDFNIPGLGALNEDAEYLRSLEVGQLSDLIKNQEMAAVVQVVEERPDYDPKLEEVKAQVDKAIRQERAIELAKAAAEQSLKAVQGGAPFAQALAGAPKAPFTTKPFTRVESAEGLDAPLVDFAKQALQLKAGSTGLSAYGQSQDRPNGYAVWQVKAIEPASREQFAQDRRQFEQDYLNMQRQTVVREWLADQRRAAEFQVVQEKD